MATYYMDFEGGNNSNNGTSFALRKKDVLPSLAAGDTVRFMASPDPISLGNATWVHDGNITFGSQLTTDLYKDGAWTAAANVTCSVSTTLEKEGANCTSITFGTGFTTGRAAHYATGTLDLSAYDAISFWFRSSLATANASIYQIALCDDTGGVTANATLTLPSIPLLANNWTAITIENGSSFANATSIDSVALYTTSDPGIPVIHIDNLFATTNVRLDALYSKQSALDPEVSAGEELWWPLRSIVVNGGNTTGIFEYEGPNSQASTASNGYTGANATCITYMLEPIKVAANATQAASILTVATSGNSTHPITYSGGWDRGNMTTQTGATWVTPQNSSGRLFPISALDYMCLENFGIDRGNMMVNLAAGAIDHTLVKLYATRCLGSSPIYSASFSGWLKLTNCVSIANGDYGMEVAGTVVTMDHCFVACNYQIGVQAQGLRTIINDCQFYDASAFGCLILQNCHGILNRVTLGRGNHGIRLDGGGILGTDVTISQCVAYSISMLRLSTLEIVNLTTSGPTVGIDVKTESPSLNRAPNTIKTHNWSFGEATPVDILSSSDTTAISTRDDGVAGATVIRVDGGTIQSQTAVRYTASGVAWKLSPTSTVRDVLRPLTQCVGQVLCTSGVATTIAVRMRRTHDTGITGTLRLKAHSLAGVGASDLTDSIGAVADTWEQRSITFTPTETGFVDVWIEAYGGTTYSLYWDDLTVAPQTTLDASSGDYAFYKTGVLLQSGNGTGGGNGTAAFAPIGSAVIGAGVVLS